MLSRSFTTIFNGLLLAAAVGAFLLPTFLAEIFLVERFSVQGDEMGMQRLSLSLAAGRHVVVVGDSTARMEDAKYLQGAGTSADMVNLAIGGSSVPDWYFTLRNFLQKPNDAKVAVVAFSQTSSLESAQLTYTYLPFIVNFSDIYSFYRAKLVDAETAARLFHFRSLRLLAARSGVFSRMIVWAFPSMSRLVQEVFVYESETANIKRSNSLGGPAFSRVHFMEKLLSLAQEKGIKLVLAKSPVSARKRKPPHYTDDQNRFWLYCKTYELPCVDLSTALKDEDFYDDGMHIRANQLYKYRNLIDQFLIRERLIKESLYE